MRDFLFFARSRLCILRIGISADLELRKKYFYFAIKSHKIVIVAHSYDFICVFFHITYTFVTRTVDTRMGYVVYFASSNLRSMKAKLMKIAKMFNKIIITVVLNALIAIVAFGEEVSYFSAGYFGFNEHDTASRLCAWSKSDESESYFHDSRLYIEDDEVSLRPDWEFDAEKSSMILTFRMTVQCDGFEELPEPPLKSDGYSAAVAPMDGGNYFVLGYDSQGRTNRWIDSGIQAVADREVSIVLRYAYTNSEHIATYEFDGRKTAPVKVCGSRMRSSEFSGCGTVSRFVGYYEEVAPLVQLAPPEIDGLIVMVADARYEAYVGECITVNFGTIPMSQYMASRTSAKYRVNPDGSLAFADEGNEPVAVPVEATVNGRPYAEIEEALAAAGPSDIVCVMRDVRFNGDMTVDCGVLDLNGHYVDPIDFCGTVFINSRGIYSSPGDEYWRHGVIDAISRVNVSLDLRYQDVQLYQVVLGAPGVEIITRYPISYYSAFDDAYEVEVGETEDGFYRYALERIAPVVKDGLVGTVKKNDGSDLLGCSPEEVDEEMEKFRIESIGMVSGEWVVTVTGGKRHGDRYGNGYVRIYKVDASGNPTDDPKSTLFRAALVPDPPSD